MTPTISAIVVTHNSDQVIGKCLEGLRAQTGCMLKIIVVDSGSNDTQYLENVQKRYHCELIRAENVGFSRANNLGYQKILPDSVMVAFVNPDVVLPSDYLQRAFFILEKEKKVAVISGVIEGYDITEAQPTGRIDSTGIFRSWYGRWYDRDHGRKIAKAKRERRFLPAVCGALLACRKSALDSLGEHIFDPDFFLYKEDIELSIRLRKQGWKLLFDPELTAYHGRGWNKSRKKVPWNLRLLASESEVLLYKKHPSPYMLWALFKYSLVRTLKL